MNELSVAGRPMPRNAKRRRVALGDRTNQQPAAQPSGPGKAGGKKKQQQKTKKKQPKKASAAPLPAGWEAEVSRESGETYYRNTLSDEAQWELPVEPAVDSARIEAQVNAALQELDDSGIRVIACVPRLSACPPAASPAGAWAETSPRAAQRGGPEVREDAGRRRLRHRAPGDRGPGRRARAGGRQDAGVHRPRRLRGEAGGVQAGGHRRVGSEQPFPQPGTRTTRPALCPAPCRQHLALCPQKESRLCATLGVAHDARKTHVRLHLVLESVDCDGDLHETIHGSEHWECLRSGGEDTGLKLKSRYATTDDDDDAWGFTMPRKLKLMVAEDLARCAVPVAS